MIADFYGKCLFILEFPISRPHTHTHTHTHTHIYIYIMHSTHLEKDFKELLV